MKYQEQYKNYLWLIKKTQPDVEPLSYNDFVAQYIKGKSILTNINQIKEIHKIGRK